MVFKSKLPLFCLVIFALFLISAASDDPELKQCKHQCRAQQHADEPMVRKCLQACEDYHREKQEREHEGGGGHGRGDVFNGESPKEHLTACVKQCEQVGRSQKQYCRQQCLDAYDRERKEEGSRGRGRGEGGDSDILYKSDPVARLTTCMGECYKLFPEKRKACRKQCEDEFFREEEEEEEKKEGGRGSGGRGEGGGSDVPLKSDPEERLRACVIKCYDEPGRTEKLACQDRCIEEYVGEDEQKKRNHHHSSRQSEEEEGQQERDENPYVFEDQHFSTPIKTQHGRVRILQKFTDRSKLLRGIENYRITILEAEPQTFIVPNHWDAEILAFVANGRGTVSMVRSERRESFNIKRGDIVRIPAGTTTYLINQDNNERLILAKLLQPVATPGDIESFFGAGGENPQSFYRAFSNDLLEAAFNAKSDRIQRIFGQQKQGIIIKASQEQIRALSRHEEGGIWPFGGESKGTINMFQQRPTQENQYGRLYEVAPEDHRQLEDLEVAVSYMNLTKGAMSGPMYMSKATKISIVVRGEGYFEMACPHMSSQSRQGREGGRQGSPMGYQKVSTPLRVGTVVVIPAGHPFATVASNNQNLEMVCFEVNARNSQRFALAGQRNVVNQLEREAKELAFGVPAREVEEVFNSQEQEYFFKGPRQQHQGHADA